MTNDHDSLTAHDVWVCNYCNEMPCLYKTERDANPPGYCPVDGSDKSDHWRKLEADKDD